MSNNLLLDNFVENVIKENPLHANFIRSSTENMSVSRRGKLSDYISYCLKNKITMEELVDSYNTITVDTQIEQIYFRKHKSYRWSKFTEVAERVYFDAQYMRKYMYGLALTSFLWPNHAAIHDFFLQTFPRGVKGNYLEVGPGHGYYFMEAATLGGFAKLTGVDISASSIAMTRDILSHYGVKNSCDVELIEADFLSLELVSEPYSCIVMGEVLEHVENPADFLKKLAELSSPDTHIYVTTCINAPAVDHIYLFNKPSEIEEMALSCGLRVKNNLYTPYGNLTVEDSINQLLPVNVAYTLNKI